MKTYKEFKSGQHKEEKTFIERRLMANDWNKKQTYESLDIARTTFDRILERHFDIRKRAAGA